MQLLLAGPKRDARQAVQQLRRAANAGHLDAMAALACCYRKGWGVSRNPQAALRWSEQAAQGDSALGLHEYAVCLEELKGAPADHSGPWFKRAADRIPELGATPLGMMKLGSMYAAGDGVAMNAELSYHWTLQAAEAGVVAAQFNLGACYTEGRGVPFNEAQGVYWWRKAAEHGDAFAQVYLALAYMDGRGVERDTAVAARLLLQAARAGQTKAQCHLGLLYVDGLGGFPRDLREARRWLQLCLLAPYPPTGHVAARGKARLQYLQRSVWSLCAILLPKPIWWAPMLDDTLLAGDGRVTQALVDEKRRLLHALGLDAPYVLKGQRLPHQTEVAAPSLFVLVEFVCAVLLIAVRCSIHMKYSPQYCRSLQMCSPSSSVPSGRNTGLPCLVRSCVRLFVRLVRFRSFF
jgi:TPR repeat protein